MKRKLAIKLLLVFTMMFGICFATKEPVIAKEYPNIQKLKEFIKNNGYKLKTYDESDNYIGDYYQVQEGNVTFCYYEYSYYEDIIIRSHVVINNDISLDIPFSLYGMPDINRFIIRKYTGGYNIKFAAHAMPSIDMHNFKINDNISFDYDGYDSEFKGIDLAAHFKNSLKDWHDLLLEKVGFGIDTIGFDNIFAEMANDQDKVKNFISRNYNLCLNRPADKSGLNYWVNELNSGRQTAAQVVEGFFFSKEMNNMKLSDSQFIDRCYRVMLDRAADNSGKSYWINKLSTGMSRKVVLKGFVGSKEFTNVCKTYNVTKGDIALTEARDLNEGITGFVSRCYSKVLGRKHDVNGLNFWCSSISGSQNKRQAALDAATDGFFHSKEFSDKKCSDKEFIKICYRAFLDREAEASGLNYWLNELSRIGRDGVLKGFADSNEFNNIMTKYGL